MQVKPMPDFIASVDTRTQTPASIGADMWAGAGDQDIGEAIEAYGSIQAAAEAAAELFAETGAQWRDYDNTILDVATYVAEYLR